MRVPNAVHEQEPWLIAAIAPDFALLDAWVLPAQGSAEDFDALLDIFASLDPTKAHSGISRMLFAVRFRLGAWFGWDDDTEPLPIPGCDETTLSARLPQGLRGSAGDAAASGPSGFVPLYRTPNEAAAEISNGTVHGVLHVGWVDQGDGRYRGQMGVYVKPRGRLGSVYLTLIGPFRHALVYPALMRHIGRAWDRRTTQRG